MRRWQITRKRLVRGVGILLLIAASIVLGWGNGRGNDQALSSSTQPTVTQSSGR